MNKNLNSQKLNRKSFLVGSGTCLSLPLLESFAGDKAHQPVQRFVAVANPFGMIQDAFFPQKEGFDTALPLNLKTFEALRGDFTVFSNLDHGIKGGHSGTHTFLSGVRQTEASSMPEGNISLDQRLSEYTEGQSRFSVINTSAGKGSIALSWTRSGVQVPPIKKVSQFFRMLFQNDSPEQMAQQVARYESQTSILDTVLENAKSMLKRVNHHDRRKMDQYFTSVREVEKKIQLEQEWVYKPRPKVDMKEPQDGPVTKQLPILFDLITLAFQTDSTRVATIEVPEDFDTSGLGKSTTGYHGYSHHGKSPDLMKGMRKVEGFQMKLLSEFISSLKGLDLLKTTQVVYGSGMGDGSAHTNHNLPVLLAGGSYKHQTHKAFPEEKEKRVPLSNLYLTIAKSFGVETQKFGHSNGLIEDFS